MRTIFANVDDDGGLQIGVQRVILQYVLDLLSREWVIGIEFDGTFGAAITVAPVVAQKPVAQRNARSGLCIGSERRVYLIASCVEIGQSAYELLAYPLSRKRGGYIQCPRIDFRRDRRGSGGFVGRSIDGVLVTHAAQHEIAPFQRTLWTVDRVARRWRLWDACEHRKLRQLEVLQGFAVVGEGRCLRPICAFAEWHNVDVQL